MRAIGITRTSDTDDRGDRLRTLDVQTTVIERHADTQEWDLLRVIHEPDVSGNAPLARRPKLLEAIGELETGRADLIVFAQSSRAFRNAAVQREAIQRVEAAGGELHCVDIGRLVDANGTDDEWFNGSLHGILDEKQLRVIRSTSMAGVDRGVAAGQVPGMLIPGLARADDGSIVIVEREAKAMREAVAMRARGATYREIRAMLREHGIERSQAAISELVRNEQLIGVHEFGRHTFTVPAIIEDTAVFERAKATVVSRGRKPRSERLLARLDVLHCHCGRRMVVSGSKRNGVHYANYRCPTTGDCQAKQSISATLVERYVREWLDENAPDEEGAASSLERHNRVKEELANAEADLEELIRTLEVVAGSDAAKQRIEEASARCNALAEKEKRLGALAGTARKASMRDWEILSLAERRALITTFIDCVVIFPGRGVDRIVIRELLVE